MNNFITLQIKEPVAFAMFLGYIGLVRIFTTSGIFFNVPFSMNNFNFTGFNFINFFKCVIIRITVTQGNYKFIYKR